MKTVPTVRLVEPADTHAVPGLPDELQLALTDIAGAAREGLLAMSVAAGLAVMQAMFEAEITAAAGPKGKHNPDRAAVRHGRSPGSVTLGGRRVPVSPPAGAHRRWARGAAGQLRVLRRRRPAQPGGAGADAGRGGDPPARPRRRAGRRAGQPDCEVDEPVRDLAPVRPPDRDRAGRADGPRPERAGHQGADARRRAHGRTVRGGCAGHHRRGHQDPGRAVGRLHGEQDRGQGAARRPGRARPIGRGRAAGRPRRRQGAVRGGAGGLRRQGRRAALHFAQAAQRR